MQALERYGEIEFRMIEVKNLTKKYGSKIAIDNISFTVDEGEIIGFLGANGAGKTTTMRILTGYISATQGQARVAGFDIDVNPLDVRKNIGYLPETVPLYTDMRVKEYLFFRSRIKGLNSKQARVQVDEVLEKCWIRDVQNKIIDTLSKGYRQRVGLADALLGYPKLLVLDEPTVGLDPKQIIKIRELIRELGKTHTILLSSHILPEVEMLCQKVIIIHEGKIVAQDTPQALHTRICGGKCIDLEIKDVSQKDIKKAFSSVTDIQDMKMQRQDGYVCIKIQTDSQNDIREEIFKIVVQHGWVLRELRLSKTSLEDVFIQITKSTKSSPESGVESPESLRDSK